MKKIFCIYIAIVSFFSACNGLGSNEAGLLSSSGRSSEIMVVCPNSDWKTTLGDSLQSVLMQPLPHLPQEEPFFTLSHVTAENFSAAYQKQRNILYFDINSKINDPKVTISYNVWAEPQILIRISSNSIDNAISLFSNNANKIKNLVLQSEFKRFHRAHLSRQDFKISSILKQNYNLDMIVPQGYFFAVKRKDFLWLRKETKDWGQNVMIFIENYTDTCQFNKNYILNLRDTLSKKYVFGSVENSYMTTEKNILPAECYYMYNNPYYTIKTEGLWKMNGDFMGGPFISYTMLDTIFNRVVTVDGFLYAPSDSKRDLLRQIETILKSTVFISNE